MGQAFMTRRGGGGKKLPELDLPAIASHIVEGYEAINGEGEKMVGTLGSNITNPATAAQITAGYQAINGLGELITGTAVSYRINTNSRTIASRNEGKAQTLTCTASGSEIILAIVYMDGENGEDLSGVGTLLGSTEARIGFASIFTKISYSGNVVTVAIDENDSYGGDTWHVWILSK